MNTTDFLKFASVDIGSNAIRLLLCNVYSGKSEPVFKKAELIRFPLRLGEDAFLKGFISPETSNKLIKVLKAFRLIIEAYDVISFRVCATSAMREAGNNQEVIALVKKEAGLAIEIIDGRMEAEIIYSNHIAEHLDNDSSYLYIDVGGGSTELTLFDRGKVIATNSFNVGTIRLLHDKVSKDQWRNFKDEVKLMTAQHHSIIGIGSGGNINKIFKLAGKKENQFLYFDRFRELYKTVSDHTYEERINILKLNPDRADVIVPAFRIFNAIMKAANINQIMVPQIGLSDGIVHLLYENYCSKVNH